jgi:hypothetical protein
MRTVRVPLLASLVVAALAVLTGLASAAGRVTEILNPANANGASDHVAFSKDSRNVRLMAYDSQASNITPDDANGHRDVFLVTRSQPGTNSDFSGPTSIVSVSSAGTPSNGDSSKPAIDGGNSPHCIVFESTATNLDAHDNNPDSDIYIRDLRRRTTKLVSLNLTNAENPSIDMKCQVVAFDAAGAVWVRDLVKQKTIRIAPGTNPSLQTNGKGVAYERGGHIFYQAFARKFRAHKNLVKTGRQVLVDRNGSGQAGNGISANPSMDDNGYYVAFESTSSNLCKPSVCAGIGGEDRYPGKSQIYRRTLNKRKAPSHDYMQVASYSQGCSATNPSGKQVDQEGNGDSNNPSITGAGENIVFDSTATNLYEPGRSAAFADPNGAVRDIYYWNFPRGRKCGNVSRESRDDSAPPLTGQPYDGDSFNPAASNRANFIGFTSDATGVGGEQNGRLIPDAFVRFLGGQ